jgi:hypothetical protein
MYRTKWLLLLTLAIVVRPTANAAEHPRIQSDWRASVLVVDGRQDDWTGALSPLGDAPISIQAVNDNEFIYLRLAASDPDVRQLLTRRGLIVWFDQTGGTKKKLGIHYPVIEAGSGDDERARGGFGRGRQGTGEGDGAGGDYEAPDRVDILGPGKDDARSLTLDHASGVEVALRIIEGTAEYELKVPLVKTADHPYAIGATPGTTIGLGLETPKAERTSSSDRNGFGQGRRGGMGRRGPGGGGMSREGGFHAAKPIKVWSLVTLSAPPAR